MGISDFIKKSVTNYFIVVSCITVAIAILGTNFDPEATFGYEAFYSPIIIGTISVLPSFILYSRRELTFEQMILRRVLHFILLEFSLVGFAMVSGLFDGINVAIPYMISVFIIYLLSSVIGWMLDNKTANDINKGLKRIQE
jgi:hypothetical protein